MKFTPLKLKGLVLIEPDMFQDNRGCFIETWNHNDFSRQGLTEIFVQQNHCASSKGVLRGLHYQHKNPQTKLVRVVSGAVFDVAVDLRRNSPTFANWHGEILSEQNLRMLWIPEGFAHGYLVLSERAVVQYSCSRVYEPEDQHSIAWNDPNLKIAWPGLPEICPQLSEKDSRAGSLVEAEVFE
jgi:dTDP-4-dehydrorhamnose 3,5-epimerase